MDVLKKIEKMRIERGLSIYQLALLSGLTDKCIYNWYKRNTLPTIKTLSAICDAFGVTLSQFFAEDTLLEVNEEQKQLIDDFNALTPAQKNSVKAMIHAFKEDARR